MRLLNTIGLAAGAMALVAPMLAQTAISAKAGMLNVADGDIYIGDRLYTPKASEIASIPKGEILRTSEGRAEVLLTPGAFARMADSSSFRLVNNELNDVTLQVLTGGVLVEVTELLDGNAIRLRTGDATATLKKAGLYRVDAEPEAKVRVYEGEALVVADDREYVVKGSRELVASAAGWSSLKFDSKDTDPLYRWAKRRSEYIAMANLSSARTAGGSRSSNSLLGPGNWFFNRWFGTYTYVPFSRTLMSPFGYAFYTPHTVYRVYAPPQVYAPSHGGGGSGWHNGGFASGPYGSGVSLPGRSATASYGGGSMSSGGSAPAASAPSAGSAGGERSGGGAVGRGGSPGGGRGR